MKPGVFPLLPFLAPNTRFILNKIGRRNKQAHRKRGNRKEKKMMKSRLVGLRRTARNDGVSLARGRVVGRALGAGVGELGRPGGREAVGDLRRTAQHRPLVQRRAVEPHPEVRRPLAPGYRRLPVPR